MSSKIIVLAILAIVYVVTAPVDESSAIAAGAVIKTLNEQTPDGSYKAVYEQNEDKTAQEQHSLQTNSAGEGSALSIHGSYSYKENDGKVYTVDFIADENGFQHIGDHIPLDNSTGSLPEDGLIIVPDIEPNAVLSLLG